MTKRVELTWIEIDGKQITQEVLLPRDEDEVFTACGEPAIVETEKGFVNTVGEIAQGRVMFVDDEGLFGIEPHRIKNIKMLD